MKGPGNFLLFYKGKANVEVTGLLVEIENWNTKEIIISF